MNEFEEKDYGEARSFANSIYTNANNIMSIFDDIDATMKDLYGNNWASIGAENAQARYNEIRKKFSYPNKRLKNGKFKIFQNTR